MENMVFKNEFNSNNLDKEVDLIKNKLFIYLLVNQQKPDFFNKKGGFNLNLNKYN